MMMRRVSNRMMMRRRRVLKRIMRRMMMIRRRRVRKRKMTMKRRKRMMMTTTIIITIGILTVIQIERVMMIVIGVGNETYIDELQQIAKSDYYQDRNRLFTVQDFSQLQGVVRELRNLICEGQCSDFFSSRMRTRSLQTNFYNSCRGLVVSISCLQQLGGLGSNTSRDIAGFFFFLLRPIPTLSQNECAADPMRSAVKPRFVHFPDATQGKKLQQDKKSSVSENLC
jgi:hypothetical protein